MIKCPECGEQAPDGAKFCDRCGRVLDPSAASAAPVATRPPPLAAGAILKAKFEIVEPIAATSIENRYRARRIGGDEPTMVVLRERFGPKPEIQSENAADSQGEAAAPDAATAPLAPAEDPNGPRAKTAELKPPAATAEPAEAAQVASEPALESHSEPVENPPAQPPPIASRRRTRSPTEPDPPRRHRRPKPWSRQPKPPITRSAGASGRSRARRFGRGFRR